MRKLIIPFATFILIFNPGMFLNAQEIISALQTNPVIRQHLDQIKQIRHRLAKEKETPLLLPFFDDFSKESVFPDPGLWTDQYAFINTDVPVKPWNIGVATLDAINDSGAMYPDALPGPQSFIADRLTSHSIRLDSIFSPIPRAITKGDSVYFSFYYQPQGRGKAPETADSLVLEFLVSPAHDSITPSLDTLHLDDRWARVWYAEGMSLEEFHNLHNRYFRRVMIPVTDSLRFFKKTFRFRFYNCVSLASSSQPSWQANCDQWNIDYVKLDINRSMNDTTSKDVSFVERAPSFLKTYSSMPYRQYTANPTGEMQDTLNIVMSNLDSISHNCIYGYQVHETTFPFNNTYEGGNHDIQPFFIAGYPDYQPFAHPQVSFFFPIANKDSCVFDISHTLSATDVSGVGDTISYHQKFYNYFAYDDGTPDDGYGLTPAGAQMAYRFILSASPDTLRAISIYFNRTLNHANEQFFYLNVWNSDNGKPGNLLYSSIVFTEFSDNLNQPSLYRLDPPVHISGTFFVGTRQMTNDNLNIGFDRYNNARNNIFYNVTGEWVASSFTGSLMIRPYIGKEIPLSISSELTLGSTKLKIFPNPSNGSSVTFEIEGNDSGLINMALLKTSIMDVFGRKIMELPYAGHPDLSSLSPGIYLVTVTGASGAMFSPVKLIITR